jgi:hypothetical protein
MAGYSGTPLVRKLGIEEGHRVAIVDAADPLPEGLDLLPGGAVLQRSLRGTRPLDVIVLFCRSEAQLRRRLTIARRQMQRDGGVWIAWPKKASGVPTDLSDGVVREAGLAVRLVDNKVCAVDETWSALRFVIRLEDR